MLFKTIKPLINFVWPLVKQHKIYLVLLIGTNILVGTNQIFFPYIIKIVINNISTANDSQGGEWITFVHPIVYLLGFWFVLEFLSKSRDTLLTLTLPSLKMNIRVRAYNLVKCLPYSFFSKHIAGNLSHKITDLPRAYESIYQIFFFSIIPIVTIYFFSIVILAQVHTILLMLFCAWMLLQSFIIVKFCKKSLSSSIKHSSALSILNERIVDTLNNILAVKLFDKEKYEEYFIDKYGRNESIRYKNLLNHANSMKLIQGLSGSALMCSSTFFLVYAWREENLTLGDLAFISMILMNLITMTKDLGFQVLMFIKEVGAITFILQTVNFSQIDKESKTNTELHLKQGEINFRNISFSYPHKKELFKNFNLRIAGKQKLGIIGESGSGKSSLINLLLRIYEPCAGEISIDGQNIKNVSSESLRQQISIISQDPWLFRRTVAENIRYAKPDASPAEIENVCKLSHCHDFIKRLPKGYMTVIGEKGINLSGGQRQRISIARAFLKNSPIFIFDEATNALDSTTEDMIHKNLMNHIQDKTVIIIAHRLSNMKFVDRIIAINDGMIIEDGSCEELNLKESYYRKIANMQNSFYLQNG